MSLRRLCTRDDIVFAVTALAILAFGYLRIIGAPLMMDEVLHERQVANFYRGEFSLLRRLEMFPTFHLVAAGSLRLLGRYSPELLRLFAVIVSGCLVAVFYVLAKQLDSDTALQRSMQLLFLPLLFPFYFLFYTDGLALTVFLAALFFVLRSRELLACCWGIIAVLVRQNYFPWFCLIGVFGFMRSAERPGVYIQKHWYFPASAAVFLIWAYVNGGFSLQPPILTDRIAWSPGNVIFFLALLPILFFPFIVDRRREALAMLRRPLGAALFLGVLTTAFFLFDAPHPYNLFSGHLRTYLFMAVSADDIIRFGFAALSAFGALFLSVTAVSFRLPSLLVIFTAAALLPMKLIEQRYYFPVLALILLFRNQSGPKAEWGQVFYGAILSALFFEGIVRGAWFP